MKKLIFDNIKRVQSKLTIGINKKPFLATILMLLFANIILLIVATVVAMMLDNKSYNNFFLTLSQVVQWLVISSSVLLPQSVGVRVLAVFVFMIGLVLFSGTIIALTTTQTKNYIVSKANAKGKLNLENHYIILNYNPKVPAILIDMMHSPVPYTVLILSSVDKSHLNDILRHELNTAVDSTMRALNLVVRQGCPHSPIELSDICLSSAKGVLVVQSELEDASQLDVAHLLMSLSSQGLNKNCTVVIETQDHKVQKIVDDMSLSLPSLSDNSIVCYSYNNILGKFLALSILRPQFVAVAYDLLSFKNGSIYCDDCNIDILEYITQYTDSLPIYAKDGRAFFVAKSQDKLFVKRVKPISTDKLLKLSQNPKPTTKQYLILGNQEEYNYMVESLNQIDSNLDYKFYAYDKIESFLKDLKSVKNCTAVVLSNDNNDDSVVYALIAMTTHFGKDLPFELVVEIKDPNHQPNIEQFAVSTVIVSSKIISFYALQILTKSNVNEFFDTVFDYGNGEFDIWIDQAERIFDMTQGDSLRFDSYAQFVLASYHGTDNKILPLGMAHKDGNTFFCMHLDKRQSFVLRPSDNVIYTKYKKYES